MVANVGEIGWGVSICVHGLWLCMSRLGDGDVLAS